MVAMVLMNVFLFLQKYRPENLKVNTKVTFIVVNISNHGVYDHNCVGNLPMCRVCFLWFLCVFFPWVLKTFFMPG